MRRTSIDALDPIPLLVASPPCRSSAGPSPCRSPASRSPTTSRSCGRAEERGYRDFWTGETNGADGFTPLALAAAWTSEMRLGTGRREPVHARDPGARPARRRAGRRLARALQPRPRVVVERDRRALERRAVHQAADARARGRRGAAPDPRGRARARRVQARDGAGAPRADLRRGAARPHAAARRREGRRDVRELPAAVRRCRTSPSRSARASAAASREGESEVVCRFFCIPQSPEEGMGVARFLLSAYATVPVYEAFFRALGWGDALDPMVKAWNEGDRKLALERAPEDLIREIVIFGSPEEHARAARRVRRGRDHDAGADVPERARAAAGPDRRARPLSLERVWPDRGAGDRRTSSSARARRARGPAARRRR